MVVLLDFQKVNFLIFDTSYNLKGSFDDLFVIQYFSSTIVHNLVATLKNN